MNQKGNTLVAILLIIIVTVGIVFIYINRQKTQFSEAGEKSTTTKNILSPFSQLTEKIATKIKEPEYPLGKPIVGVLFGIDRRHRDEGYRTDIMIIVAANPDTNKVVLASVPRDLWYGSGRINALYPAEGWEAFQKATEELTGLKPTRFVLTDFSDFKWVVDAMGGVPVTVETTFTDSSYPVDATFEYQTVSFTKGYEKLTGERALIYSRSRKGDFDNGDWGRMKRQHNILKGMLLAVVQPESLFNPMVVEQAYKTVTEGKMDTNLSVTDAKYIWDFYKDKDKYQIDSIFMNYDYLYTPPAEEYGGAWVMAPKPGGVEQFKKDIYNLLYDIKPEPQTTPTQETYQEEVQNNVPNRQ